MSPLSRLARPLLVCLALPAAGPARAAPFDCSLSADRVTMMTDDLRRDATDYGNLRSESGVIVGAFRTGRDEAALTDRRLGAIYIRRTMPAKMRALGTEIDKAALHGCLTDTAATAAHDRARTLADPVLSDAR